MDLPQSLVAESHERTIPAFIPRSIRLPEAASHANVLIGMRRSGKTFRLFQEMHVSDPRTREREVRALVEARSELQVAEAVIVTLHTDEIVDTPVGQIRMVPAWRWMLGIHGDGQRSWEERARRSRKRAQEPRFRS